jgi:hypothetical protein
MEFLACLVILVLQKGFILRNWILSTEGFLFCSVNSIAADIFGEFIIISGIGPFIIIEAFIWDALSSNPCRNVSFMYLVVGLLRFLAVFLGYPSLTLG